MRKNKITLAVIAALAIVLVSFQSCKKDAIDDSTEKGMDRISYFPNGERTTAPSGSTILGVKLANPYTVSNMQEAYDNLIAEDPTFPVISIIANHKYVKFMPQNEAQLDLLKRDTTIILYDIPLDYEIVKNGTFYHDPSLPDSAITYQYCSVPVSKVLPGIPHSILEYLYIPPTEYDPLLRGEDEMIPYYEALEEEALRITDNLDSDENTRANHWTPAGTIKMIDDVLGTVPIAGVKVKARRWFVTHTGITNAQGYFVCDGQFKRPANYSFEWERYHFSIRDGRHGQAKYDGPKQEGDWNLVISGGTPEFHAIIFRAAFHYYYGNIQNLRRPPLNDVWESQMKISAMYEENSDLMGVHYGHWLFTTGIFSRIKIYNPQELSDVIYSAVIHELAHAVHWSMDTDLYNEYDALGIDRIVKESWASGVQWVLTKMVYPNYVNDNYIRCLYTGVVEDMIDGFGNKGTTQYCYEIDGAYVVANEGLLYYDRVTGYTIKQIENALVGTQTWNAWRDKMRGMYNNSTEVHLNSAFKYWNTQTDDPVVSPPIEDDDTLIN